MAKVRPLQLNSKRGFTLIESFVAITILVIAVLGPLSMLAQAIANGNYAKNQITAFYLAQEGQELVINERDNVRIKYGGATSNNPDEDNYWLGDLEECSSLKTEQRKYCQIDSFTGKVSIFPTITGQVPDPFDLLPMRRDTDDLAPVSEGLYYYPGDSANRPEDNTIFTRYIRIERHAEVPCDAICDLTTYEPEYAKVFVTVTWTHKNLPLQQFTLVTTIFK